MRISSQSIQNNTEPNPSMTPEKLKTCVHQIVEQGFKQNKSVEQVVKSVNVLIGSHIPESKKAGLPCQSGQIKKWVTTQFAHLGNQIEQSPKETIRAFLGTRAALVVGAGPETHLGMFYDFKSGATLPEKVGYYWYPATCVGLDVDAGGEAGAVIGKITAPSVTFNAGLSLVGDSASKDPQSKETMGGSVSVSASPLPASLSSCATGSIGIERTVQQDVDVLKNVINYFRP